MPSCVLLLACERVNAERIDCGAPQPANLEVLRLKAEDEDATAF
jgi:hypothetical protein